MNIMLYRDVGKIALHIHFSVTFSEFHLDMRLSVAWRLSNLVLYGLYRYPAGISIQFQCRFIVLYSFYKLMNCHNDYP